MQAASLLTNGAFAFRGTTTSKSIVQRRRLPKPPRTLTSRKVLAAAAAAAAAAAPENSSVDYSSTTSVFPAEACDTIGGEACNVEMFPEVKPAASITSSKASMSREEVEREYIEYNDPKTVFPGEACDDLGGEFCEPEYQQGVFAEKKASE